VAENLTTTTQVDPAVAIFYDRVLLKRGKPKLIHTIFGQKKNLGSKKGNTMKFRRYSALTVATTPLSEGVTPPGQQLSKTDLLAQVSQYGDYVHVTDVVDMTVEDPVLTVANEELGDQMGRTIDVIVRDILAATASTDDCDLGTNGDTPTELTKNDIDTKAVQVLLGNNAEMHTSLVRASSGQGTSPIRPAFWGLSEIDLIDDLEAVSGFKSTAQYPAQSGVLDAEWGATGNVRWLVTTEGYVSAGTSTLSADEYFNFILGKNAYGIIDLDAGNVKSIVKAFGSGGTSDPLNQRATAGWKAFFVARILNDNFMLNLKCTHS